MELSTPSMEPATAFQPEHPIERPEEDELGRFPFAEQFAAAVRDHLGDESLVIALNGAWGSGKSSIWKMAQFALEKDQKRKTPEIVYFPLWEISGAEPLAAEFFSKLSSAVDRALVNAGEPPLRGLVLRYGERVAGGLETVGKLSEAAGELGVSWLSFAGKVTGVVSGWFSASKEKLKARIAESLRRLPQPVIVVFDDIDRLTAEEVALLFRLVKANGDFPRFVYVLLFDREYAQAALDGVTGGRGAEFIEKVVQVTIDVPPPDPDQLRAVLDGELRRLAGELSVVATAWLDERMSILMDTVLLAAVRHMRDVRRYINSLRFHFRATVEHGVFQANFVDLAALEAARVWVPNFYANLPRNRERLIRDARWPIWPDRRRDYEEWFKSLVGLAGEGYRKMAESVLELVFCLSEKVTTRKFGDELLAHRRAAHNDFFDLYFRFQLPSIALGQHDVNALLAGAESSTGFADVLRGFIEAGRTAVVIDYLIAHKPEDAGHRQNIVQGIVDVSDELIMARRPELRGNALASNLAQVIAAQLRAEPDIRKRTETAFAVVRNAKALSGAVEVAWTELDEERRKHYRPDYWLIAEDRRDELRAILLAHFSAFQETTLPHLDRYVAMYLRLWRDWGGAAEVAEWIRRRLATKEGFLQLVGMFEATTEGVVHFEAGYLAWFIPWGEVATARLKHFGSEQSTSEPLLQQFDEGVKRDREKLDALAATSKAKPKSRRKKRS